MHTQIINISGESESYSSQPSSIHCIGWVPPSLFVCSSCHGDIFSSSFSFFGRPRHPRIPLHLHPRQPLDPFTPPPPLLNSGVACEKILYEIVWNCEEIDQTIFDKRNFPREMVSKGEKTGQITFFCLPAPWPCDFFFYFPLSTWDEHSCKLV